MGMLLILGALVVAAGVRRGRVIAANRPAPTSGENIRGFTEAEAQAIAQTPNAAASATEQADGAPIWTHTFDTMGTVTITTYEQWMAFFDRAAKVDNKTDRDNQKLAELMFWGNSAFKAWERG